jgi:transcriptional regulator GlxA family with amidase domain
MDAMNNFHNLKLVKPTTDRCRLDQLCEWIEANIDKPIGWAELTTQSGMDHLELQREFSAHFKTSPMQWIRSRRIDSKKSSMADMMGEIGRQNWQVVQAKG